MHIQKETNPLYAQLKFLQQAQKSYNSDILKFLEHLMSPKGNGFKTGRFSELPFEKDREVWFSGSTLALSKAAYFGSTVSVEDMFFAFVKGVVEDNESWLEELNDKHQ